MSREHQTEQAAQQDPNANADSEQDASYGLPPFLYKQLLAMGPSQADDLAKLLRQFPNWKEQICSVASHQMPMSVVQNAIETAAAGDKTDAAADRTKDSTEEIWAQHFDYQLEISKMGPGDAEKLAAMLRKLPHFRTQILRVATPTMGTAAVEEAQAIARNADVQRDHERDEARKAAVAAEAGKSKAEKDKEAKDEQAASTAQGQAESAQFKKDQETSQWLKENNPETYRQLGLIGADVQKVAYLLGFGTEEVRAQIRAIVTVRYGEGFAQQAQAQADADREATRAGAHARPSGSAAIDVAAARRYNHANASFVDRFNQATRNSFVGPGGEIDPTEIVTFQETEHLTADGRIGPHTVAAAEANYEDHNEGLE